MIGYGWKKGEPEKVPGTLKLDAWYIDQRSMDVGDLAQEIEGACIVIEREGREEPLLELTLTMDEVSELLAKLVEIEDHDDETQFVDSYAQSIF